MRATASASLLALAIAAALPPAALAGRQGVERVLLLSDDDVAAARLERDLNERSSGSLFVVFPLPSREAESLGAQGLPAVLEFYSPGSVVAVVGDKETGWSRRLSDVAGLLRARGAALVLAHGAGPEAATFHAGLPSGADVVLVENGGAFEGVVPALQKRLGVDRAAAAVTRDDRDRLSRRANEIHRQYAAGVEERRLSELLKSDPENLEALGALAAIHRSHIQFWHALSYLDRMAASKKASPAQRADLLRQAGELRLQIGDPSAAAADFRRGLELMPGDSALLRLLAEADRERPEAAIAHADAAAAAKGATAHLRSRANRLAGELRADIGDLAGAERKLALALKDAPGDLDTLHAIVRIKRDRKAEALPHAERASREAAKAPLWMRGAAHRLAARIWLLIGDHSRAADELGLALRLDPEDLDALRLLLPIKDRLEPARLAGLRWGASSPSEGQGREPKPMGEAGARSALDSNPDDLEALFRLAELDLDRKRRSQAASWAQRLMDAVWRAPVWQREDAALALARLWLKIGDRAKARLVMNRVLDLQSDSIATWRAAVEMSHREASIEDPSWVIGSYCTAAVMRRDLGDTAGAEEELKRALKLSPSDPWALELMAALQKPR